MLIRFPVARWLMALLTVGLAIVSAGPTVAQTQTQTQQIQLEVSSGKLVNLPRPAKSVFVADPNIADLQVPSPRNVFVYGKKAGSTSVYALDEEGRQILRAEVVVSYNVTALMRAVQQDVPNATVKFSSTPSGLQLSGVVPDAQTAQKVQLIAGRYIGDKEALVNDLKVSGSQQINLRVRVAEVSRQITKELGFNWETIANAGSFTFGLSTGRPDAILSAAGLLTRAPPPQNVTAVPGALFGSYNSHSASVNTLIDALADNGLVTVLAEPNLTTVSGQPASFLAGGEFPIPVQQNGANNGITIEFKQFGVSLAFVPTVLANDHISIKVRPEVSQLSNQGAITLNSITVPALTVRRAETTVELGSGESFAIAGLIQNDTNTDLSKYPGLGDVPVLGPLFRSTNFQRHESELVIIVTPYVVRPASANALGLPTDGFQPANDLERIFLQRFNKPGVSGQLGITGERLKGDAGFMIN